MLAVLDVDKQCLNKGHQFFSNYYVSVKVMNESKREKLLHDFLPGQQFQTLLICEQLLF